jgi:hypothetical protein
LNNFSYPEEPTPMKKKSERERQLVAKRNNCSTVNCRTKTPVEFQEVFEFFRGMSKFFLFFSKMLTVNRKSKLSIAE